MAKDTVQMQGFIEALEQDSYLQAQFSVASPNSLDGVVDFASAKGYVFAKEELEIALKHDLDSTVLEQLRQNVGCPRAESGIVRNLFPRHLGLRLAHPQPGRW